MTRLIVIKPSCSCVIKISPFSRTPHPRLRSASYSNIRSSITITLNDDRRIDSECQVLRRFLLDTSHCQADEAGQAANLGAGERAMALSEWRATSRGRHTSNYRRAGCCGEDT